MWYSYTMGRKQVLIPIVFALFCAASIGLVLWWQLRQTTLLLSENLATAQSATESAAKTFTTLFLDPRDEALMELRRGDLLAMHGEWAEAQGHYERAVAKNGGLPALRKLASAQLQRRDIRGVYTTLEQLKRAGARSEDLLLLESIILLRTAEIAKAETLLQNAADSPQKHYALTLLEIVRGNHNRVREELALVIGGWEPVLRSNAKTLQAAYDEYALFPESPFIHLTTLLARALAQVQECELALPLLSPVLNVQDDYRDAWIVQGFCELQTERYQQALVSFERAYALDPEKPEIQYFLGRTFAVLQDHTSALTFYGYALRNGFSPENEVRLRIAKSAEQGSDPTLALEQYKALLEMENPEFEIFQGFVAIARALERNEEAYVVALKASERFSRDARAFELLGTAALSAGHRDEAREAFAHALSLNPNLGGAKEKLKQLDGGNR